MVKYLLFVVAAANLLLAKIHKVPADFSTIQAAINSSSNGDTVVVYPGTYFENINYRGKNIVVTSRFYEQRDMTFIYSTVIDGSKPSHQDTASVVLFINHEDSTAVIQGFTITGGKGTAWPDEHSPGTYIEGGGILAALSSPKILHNLIINNEAIASRFGIASGGGGGIRVGDGNPYIANNTIMNNRGKYGAGLVANYTGMILRNNIIVGNTGGSDFGGGGIWLNGPGPKPKYIENNTIVGNQSVSDGGGVLLLDESAAAIFKNNIIWGNSAKSFPQVSLRSGAVITASFNSIQDGNFGSSNLNVHPMFEDSLLILRSQSPLVDAGDSSASYHDKNNSGTALFPSKGTLRNDIGAYGGPYASPLPVVATKWFVVSAMQVHFGNILPDSLVSSIVRLHHHGTRPLTIDSITVKLNTSKNIILSGAGSRSISASETDSVVVNWHPLQSQRLMDTLRIYHNDTTQKNPILVSLTGNAFTIEKVVKGKMYAGSGTIDSAKMYSIDTMTHSVIAIGKSGFSQILSMRIHPKTQELIVLVNSAIPQLARISSTTAESFMLPQLALSNPKGMAFAPNGALLVGLFNGSVYSINMQTGATTLMASNGLKISGMAFNPVNGTFWMSVRPLASGKDNIYKVNPVTMQGVLVGATGFGVATKDITFDETGQLYGVIDTTGMQSYLIRIDTLSGKGTVVGGLGVKGIETIELASHFITGNVKNRESIPAEFALSQNYPNPFNPSTSIEFSLPVSGHVTLKIYDILGKEVGTLMKEQRSAGKHTVNVNASSMASGVYFYQIVTRDFVSTRKMILTK